MLCYYLNVHFQCQRVKHHALETWGELEVNLHDLVTYAPDDDGRLTAYLEGFISWQSVILCIQKSVFTLRDFNPPP